MESVTESDATDYQDRSGWLIAFGVFEWVAAGFMGFSKWRSWSSLQSMTTGAMLDYTLLIALAAIGKRVILGWGSMKARRWARALFLISSWFNLAAGLVAVPMTLWMMNRIPLNGPQITPRFRLVMGLIAGGSTFLIAVLMPWIFIRFYGGQNVKRTCEARNPIPSWTDSCPLPVLGLALFLALGAVQAPFVAFLPEIRFPVLAWAIGGVGSKLLALAWGAAMAYAAYRLYRMSMAGFRWAVGLTGLGLVNGVIFFGAKGWDGFMGLLNPSVFSKELMSMMVVMKPMLGWMILASLMAMIAYMIFVKMRYFSS